MCVFAHHNILSDPPFARVDFISCCNLLIYLDTAAQKKSIATFHYALNNNGFLMLGKSETVGQSTQLFSPRNKKFKIIFPEKIIQAQKPFTCFSPTPFQISLQPPIQSPLYRKKSDKIMLSVMRALIKPLMRLCLLRYMPASIIINEQLEILQFPRAQQTPYISSQVWAKPRLKYFKKMNNAPKLLFERRAANFPRH